MTLKSSDVRNMTATEISHKLVSLREDLYKLRFEQKTGRVEKPHRIRIAKREIARCLTILREKENAKKQD